MIYSYEAKDGGGRTVTGSLDAQDERTAARQVRDMGYFLMRLAPDGPPTQLPPPRVGVAPSPGAGEGRRETRPSGDWPSGDAVPEMPWGKWLLARLV